METQVIQVPYDTGRKGFGTGSGPAHLVNHALGSLRDAHVGKVECEEFSFELGTTFRLLRSLSEAVGAARMRNRFPLVLAGPCISCVGTLAGLGHEPTAVVWLDAHGDFNTPETTVSGFVDGMALATATGRCWRSLTSSVPGFRPAEERNVVLIGARDFDPAERALLDSSAVTLIDTPTIRARGVSDALRGVLDPLEADRIYLHIDLDVLDIDEARVNQFSSVGGLTLAEVSEIVRTVANERPMAAAALTAYDPSYDKNGKALAAGIALMKELHAINRSGVGGTPLPADVRVH